MKNLTINKLVVLLAVSAAVTGCKAPMATLVNSEIKKNIPENYNQQDPGLDQKNSGTTPWRVFFTDPNLVSLIEISLKNNQELMITLQQIEIAKSGVLAKKGKLSPSVSAGGGIGLKKAGRYTSEGAGDASTEIEHGKEMPDPLANFDLGISANWEVDI